MANLDQQPTEVAFIGFAERAQPIQEGATPFVKWNIIGLKQNLFSFICPFSMAGVKWAIALRFGAERNLKLRIKAADGQEAGSIDLGLALSSERAGTTEVPPHATYAGSMFVDPTAWTVLLFDVSSQPPMLITQPGHYTVFKVQADGAEIQIGSFNVLLLNALPLDATRIAAIRSDPQAAKAVRIELSCKNCSSKLRAFAALDKKPEQEGYLWYGDIPDTFDCECGSTHLDVRTIKYNLHGLLGHPVSVSSSEIAFSPLYERSALLEIRRVFIELLDRGPSEEEIQKFIQDNPILLHQFPAEKLFFKPALLTFFKADFIRPATQRSSLVTQ